MSHRVFSLEAGLLRREARRLRRASLSAYVGEAARLQRIAAHWEGVADQMQEWIDRRYGNGMIWKTSSPGP